MVDIVKNMQPGFQIGRVPHTLSRTRGTWFLEDPAVEYD